MNNSKSKLFSSGQVAEKLLQTLYRVKLSDGRVMEAILTPEFRHAVSRVSKPLQINEGMNVEVELSPDWEDDNRCRIIKLID